MQKILNRTLVSGILFFFGLVAVTQAQGGIVTSVESGFGTLADLINKFSQTVVVAFGTLLMAGAVVIFFIGIVNYIWGLREGDAKKAKDGSTFMLWGLVALFVMFSVYGIVKFAQNIFFNKDDVTTITIPKLKFEGSGSSPGGGNRVCTPNTPCASTPGGALNGRCNSTGTVCSSI